MVSKFTQYIEESKERQRQIIARCDNEMDYCQIKMDKLEQERQDAQDLLGELEEKYPTGG